MARTAWPPRAPRTAPALPRARSRPDRGLSCDLLDLFDAPMRVPAIGGVPTAGRNGSECSATARWHDARRPPMHRVKVTPALCISLVALFFALGGTAFALGS